MITRRRCGVAAVWAALVVVLASGCSVAATSSALSEGGFPTASVSYQGSDVAVVASPPPGVPPDVAVERAQRIVWQTQRSPVDRLDVTVEGRTTVADRAELTARFGPRDPALDASNVDLAVLVGVFSAIGVAVLGAIVAAVAVVTVRNRRIRRSGAFPDPLWEPTRLTARRAGQFALDFLIWALLPTLGGIALTLGGDRVADDSAAGFLVVGLQIVTVAWGWLVYAWWPSRHYGRTPGMQATGLRVVTLHGDEPGLGQHTVRWLLLIVDAQFQGLVGLLTLATSRRHQRLGDMAAGTVVVRP